MSDYTPANIVKFLNVVAAVARDLHTESLFLRHMVIELTRLAIAGETAETHFLIPTVSKDQAIAQLIDLRGVGLNISIHVGQADDRGVTNCTLRYSPEPKKPENDLFLAYYEGQTRPATETEKLASALAREAAELLPVGPTEELVPVVEAEHVKSPLRSFKVDLVVDQQPLSLEFDLHDPSEIEKAVQDHLVEYYGGLETGSPMPDLQVTEQFPRHFEYTRCMKVQMACASALTGFIDLEQRHTIAECSFGPTEHNQTCLECANCGLQLTHGHRGSQPFDRSWFTIIAAYYAQQSDD